MTTLIFILLCSLADRARGMVSYMVLPFAVLLAVKSIGGWEWRTGLILTIAFIIGEMKGWGTPLDSYLARWEMKPPDVESWQVFEPIQTNIMAALWFRGFMWALPPALVAWSFNLEPIPYLLIAPAFVAAPVIVRAIFDHRRPLGHTENKLFTDKIHGYQEWVRGLLIGIAFI